MNRIVGFLVDLMLIVLALCVIVCGIAFLIFIFVAFFHPEILK